MRINSFGGQFLVPPIPETPLGSLSLPWGVSYFEGKDMKAPRVRIDGDNWLPIDKRLINYMPKDRPYTLLEAMFSYSLDVYKGSEKSLNGYARIWQWSRNKVRRFVTDLDNTGEYMPDNMKDRDRTGTGQAIRLLYDTLPVVKDRDRTGTGL